MDADEVLSQVPREPVRLSTLRFCPRPQAVDESPLILAALAGGALIGSILALI